MDPVDPLGSLDPLDPLDLVDPLDPLGRLAPYLSQVSSTLITTVDDPFHYRRRHFSQLSLTLFLNFLIRHFSQLSN